MRLGWLARAAFVFATALLALIISMGLVPLNDFYLFRQLQRISQAAGGHRPHCWRLREVAEGGGAEFFGALPFS